MNSKAPVRVKLGHVVQIHVSRFPFAVNVTLNLSGSTATRIDLIYLKYNYRDTECVKQLTETGDITNLYRAFVN